MPQTFNPQELPVVRVDTDLPAVAAEQLLPDALRARFLAPPAWQPDIAIERRFH
jgi:hypothetical protein